MSADKSAMEAPKEQGSPSGGPAPPVRPRSAQPFSSKEDANDKDANLTDTRSSPSPSDGGEVAAAMDTMHLSSPMPNGMPDSNLMGVQHAYAPGYTPMMPMQGAPSAPMPMTHMLPGQAPMGWSPAVPYMMPMHSVPVGYMPQYSAPYASSVPDYSTMGSRMPAAQSGMMVPVGRTVYVGNLPAEAAVDELLSLVKFGPIENVRLLPEKNCAFISFLSGQVAAAFHADSSVKHVSLHGQELKIGWGKPSVPPPAVVMAVQQHGASRNVYIGQLDENTTEQDLRNDLGRFGPIDQVKIVRDQSIAFVHFLSIQTAMKAVAILPTEPAWSGKRINYGKDRCAYVPKGQQQIQAHNHQAAAMGLAAATWLGYPTGYMNYGTNPPRRNSADSGDAQYHQFGNRTVYLGNLHQDTTTEDICNHVRGGILQNIRYMPDRHIAFVTFIDANAALAFYHMASVSGITIHSRRLKVGWGKPSGSLSPAMALAVQSGASRNVYMGNIDDPELMNEDKIRADLSEYGELEMVNALRERNCVRIPTDKRHSPTSPISNPPSNASRDSR